MAANQVSLSSYTKSGVSQILVYVWLFLCLIKVQNGHGVLSVSLKMRLPLSFSQEDMSLWGRYKTPDFQSRHCRDEQISFFSRSLARWITTCLLNILSMINESLGTTKHGLVIVSGIKPLIVCSYTGLQKGCSWEYWIHNELSLNISQYW